MGFRIGVALVALQLSRVRGTGGAILQEVKEQRRRMGSSTRTPPELLLPKRASVRPSTFGRDLTYCSFCIETPEIFPSSREIGGDACAHAPHLPKHLPKGGPLPPKSRRDAGNVPPFRRMTS